MIPEEVSADLAATGENVYRSNESRGRNEASSTSASIKSPSIHDALVGLLGKPIAESNALCIPTAKYALFRRADLPHEAGLEQATPPLDDAPADVDKQHDDH